MILLKEVLLADKDKLWNIFQKYFYEMSAYYDMDMDECETISSYGCTLGKHRDRVIVCCEVSESCEKGLRKQSFLFYVDNIRWMTMVLVICYHVICMHNRIATTSSKKNAK